MPTTLVNAQEFSKIFGSSLSIEQLQEICLNFGLEYDGLESQESNDDLTYRIEVPANRPDLLSVEGIAQALSIYMSNNPIALLPQYRLLPGFPNPQFKMIVKPSVVPIRPYCFCGILRGVKFTPQIYQSFIDLQDKLHQTVGRRRTLVAIGTHDLNTIQGPFTYEAQNPKEIRFVPLNMTNEMDAYELMQTLSNHPQLKSYLHIIKDSPVYPVIRDSRGIVLSLPPILNGNHSKITLNTENIFIEITTRDRTKGEIVLNTLCALFSQYCDPQYTMEPICVEYDHGHPLNPDYSQTETAKKGTSPQNPIIQKPKGKYINPNLQGSTFETSVEYIQRVTGIQDITPESICKYLNKMMIRATIIKENENDNVKIIAECPITRPDILHPCDLAEDVAAAYGYNKIQYKDSLSVKQVPWMLLGEMVRNELAVCGYNETLTWGLCSINDAFDSLSRPYKHQQEMSPSTAEYSTNREPIILDNPKSKEFEIVRVSLIPGLLKTIAANKAQPLPLKIFEVGNCGFQDKTTETGAKIVLYCAAAIANNTGACLESIHGLLDCILLKLGLVPEYHKFLTTKPRAVNNPDDKRIYKFVPCSEGQNDNAFLQGQRVDIVVEPDNMKIGLMGVVHPNVLHAFDISFPCSIFEFALTPFLDWIPETHFYH